MKATILAVSGGIDSMVMMDIFRNFPVIIAHFDHGTRPSSASDAEFVQERAKSYGFKFFLGRANLGESVSEAVARQARYDFLLSLANQFSAPVYVAQHLEDLVESVAINLLRGTGWRGLAVMNRPHIKRPFIQTDLLPSNLQNQQFFTKKEIYHWAASHQLVWRQDPTNQQENYLRNRLRLQFAHMSSSKKQQLGQLVLQQKQLSQEIHDLTLNLVQQIKLGDTQQKIYARQAFYHLDEAVALELLREIARQSNLNLLRPELTKLLHAIKTYQPGKKVNLSGGKLIDIQQSYFIC